MGLSYTAVWKKNQEHGRETEMLRSGDSPGVWFPFCESITLSLGILAWS